MNQYKIFISDTKTEIVHGTHFSFAKDQQVWIYNGNDLIAVCPATCTIIKLPEENQVEPLVANAISYALDKTTSKQGYDEFIQELKNVFVVHRKE